MIKPFLIFLGLSANFFIATAQNMVNSTGEIVVNVSSYLVVTGDVDVKNNGTVTVNGTLSFTGDMTEETGSTTTWGGSSSMLIKGGGTQNITGITSIDALTIQNSSQAVLAQNTAITGSLTLTSGTVSVGNFNLTMGNSATISGASSSNYVITNGTGALVRQVGGSAVSFPVGTGSGYNPISLANSGTTDDLSVSISDDVLQDGSSGSTVSSRVVDRTWNITEAVSGNLSLSATFQWAASDELTSFDRNNAVVYHFTGGDWIADGTTGSVSGADPYTVTVTGITSLSAFSVGDDMTVFPVEFLSFTAIQDQEIVRLNWVTARELHSDYFAIERRISSGNWEELGSVPAAGYSEEIQQYSFLDKKAPNGIIYYRLRQVDLDGNFAYSDQVEVQLDYPDIIYYPNPVSHILTLRNPGSTSLHIEMLDFTGRGVYSFDLAQGQSKINLANLPLGVYNMRIKNSDGRVRSVRLVKN